MLGDRIKEARIHKGYSQELLANKINVSKRTLINYEKNDKEPTVTTVQKIALELNINEWWLLVGKGGMLYEPLLDNDLTDEDYEILKNERLQKGKIPTNLVSISYFKDTYAAAGVGAVNYDEAPVVMAFEKEFLKEKLGITSFKHLHIINAIGNSMSPTINAGELLFVNPFENENCYIRDKDIYVVNTPGGTLVKRIKIVDPIKKEYALISDNPKDEDLPLSGDELESCRIIGRVIGHFCGL